MSRQSSKRRRPARLSSQGQATAPSGVLTEDIYVQLKQLILDCSIPPGQTFYTAELAERFGVSKTPVRDALRQLVQEGFVEVYPRSGYQVRPVLFRDVYELFELRGLLGPYSARMAAENITAEQLNELEAIVAEAYDQAASHEEIMAAARRFHLLVAQAAGNMRIVRITESLFDEMERLLRLHINLSEPVQEMGASLRALIDALRHRDGEAAADIEAEHAAASAQFVMNSVFEAARLSDMPVPIPAGASSTSIAPEQAEPQEDVQ